MSNVRILTAGEQGLVVEFGNSIDYEVNRQVHTLSNKLMERHSGEIIEVVPTYRSLLVYFDPQVISRQQLTDKITALMGQNEESQSETTARVISIPVCYGGEFGPDIAFVAQHNNLSEAEVISIHSSTPYLVYMLGFIPGFAYLGGLSERIAAPRLQQPRTHIPPGSVGIAGTQTGIYPLVSPGGWQLIGRTPMKIFDPAAVNPFLFNAGDYLHFQPITLEEYEAIGVEAAAGRYQPAIRTMPVKGGGAA